MGVIGSVGGAVAKRVAPAVTSGAVREVLERAIDGAGPVPGARRSAEAALRREGGVEAAVDALVGQHVRLAAAQGFLTNLGGVLTLAVTMPANIAAVALVQCHLVASILHLRGYALDQPAVRNAILMCLLDDDGRKAVARKSGRKVTATGLLLLDSADAAPSADLDKIIGTAVTGQLIGGLGGKQLAGFLARRIPVVGGAVGGFGDALATRRIGHDAAGLPTNPRDRLADRPAVRS